MASFAVQAFGVERLLRLDTAEMAARFEQFRQLTQFEPL